MSRITVLIGNTTSGDARLPLGTGTEVIDVTSSGLKVNAQQALVQGVLNSLQVESLPVNGRNFLDLAQLEPGVQIQDGQNFDLTKAGYSSISFGGRYGRTARIEVDGVDVSDETVGTTTADVPSSAIQEFQLSQSTLDLSNELTSSGAVKLPRALAAMTSMARHSAYSGIAQLLPIYPSHQASVHRSNDHSSGAGSADQLSGRSYSSFWIVSASRGTSSHRCRSGLLSKPFLEALLPLSVRPIHSLAWTISSLMVLTFSTGTPITRARFLLHGVKDFRFTIRRTSRVRTYWGQTSIRALSRTRFGLST